jgi:hypothetical protein
MPAMVALELEPYRLTCVRGGLNGIIGHPSQSSSGRRFSMKFVTALSTAAFVLVPVVGLAQENDKGNTKQEPGVVNKVIEKITGRSPHDANKSDDQDSSAKSKGGTDYPKGSTDYPDFSAVKKTAK